MVEDRKVVGDLLWNDIGSDRERERGGRRNEREGKRRREKERHFAAWCKEKVREARREREKSEKKKRGERERDIDRIEIDIAGALFKGLGGGGGGGGGGFGGGLMSLFSSFFGGGGGAFSGQTAGGMFVLPGEGYAKGGAFTNGVVDTTTFFNPAMMGEAGPEAIMPLARDSSGRLGVRGGGGGQNVNISFNISTPDANSFRASESQISARMHAAVVAGLRNR